jgi:VanZ family protein
MVEIFGTRLIFFVYNLTIFLLVVLPLNSAGELNHSTVLKFRGDYFFHALMFLPWCFFCGVSKSSFTRWFSYGIFYAVFAEAIQYFLPWRAFNVNDIVANLAGVGISALLAPLFFFVVRPKT